jgi:hypothetical protein
VLCVTCSKQQIVFGVDESCLLCSQICDRLNNTGFNTKVLAMTDARLLDSVSFVRTISID